MGRARLVFVLLTFALSLVDAVELYGGSKKRLHTQGLNSFLARDELDAQPQIVFTRDEATQNQEKTGGKSPKKKNRFLRLPLKDDVLALPDRFSVLQFDQVEEDFAAERNEGEEQRLSDLSFWGRLYVDGLPHPMQYFRAHFGIQPANSTVTLVWASPANMCDLEGVFTLLNAQNQIDSNTVIIVERGDCTFSEKALLVNQTGAAGILYLNNEVRKNRVHGISTATPDKTCFFST